MEKIYVDQIRENNRIDSVFLVKEKVLATGRTGKAYINLRLMDRTGEIDGKIWDNTESLSRLFKKGDFVRIKSRAQMYQGALQLVINSIERIDDENILIDEFLPRTKKDIEKMFSQLREIAAHVRDKNLRALVELFFDDHQFVRLMKVAPAAKSLHHVTIGGLLEHTLSVCRLILLLRDHYEGIDWDLLLTAGILHDVGKIHELSYDKTFDYTDRGRLAGHIIIGMEMIRKKLETIDGFPEKLAMLLEHAVISHHGELEFGSPKRPKTIEALILHCLDDMDAKVDGFKHLMEKEGDLDSSWTAYNRLFDRFLYRNMGNKRASEDKEEKTIENQTTTRLES